MQIAQLALHRVDIDGALDGERLAICIARGGSLPLRRQRVTQSGPTRRPSRELLRGSDSERPRARVSSCGVTGLARVHERRRVTVVETPGGLVRLERRVDLPFRAVPSATRSFAAALFATIASAACPSLIASSVLFSARATLPVRTCAAALWGSARTAASAAFFASPKRRAARC